MASNTSASADVLIVGAGPAGAASAILLARAGCQVILADRARFPRDKPCSEFISPEGVRVLERLGVLDSLEAGDTEPLHGLTVHASRGSHLTGLFARAAVKPWRDTGLSVRRSTLDARLVQAAWEAGVEVREGLRCVELLGGHGGRGGQDGRGGQQPGRPVRPAHPVTGAFFRDDAGRSVRISARLTIGADGIRSRVARALGGTRRGLLRRYAFVTHMRGVRALPGQAEMFVMENGYVGINPVGGGLTNVALVVPAALARDARGDPSAFLLAHCHRHPLVSARLANASLAEPVRVTGPFDVRAQRVTADGAALVGDAADFFDPFTGDGIVSALRGAELLAAVVPSVLAERGVVSRTSLRKYRKARRQAFAGKRAVARLIAYAMHCPVLFDRAVARLERREGMAHTLIGVTGEFVPARAVLNPAFLGRMVL
ncbi:MAG TPA: NAD(P)/FAD-dependent oxidoreductase [Gemmatimonadales bacterium]|nr:NAD(P)/FAD-dependent oxidoreductase [Gemmatimonadales bacterium]